MGNVRLGRSPRRGRAQTQGRRRAGGQSSLADEVLRLQREAGNAAVAGLLQRDKDKTITQTLIIESLDLVVPVESFSVSRQGPSANDEKTRHEVSVTVPSSGGSSKLMHAAVDGKHVGEVKISTHKGTWVLTECYVSSYQAGGGGGEEPTDSVAFSCTDLTYES